MSLPLQLLPIDPQLRHTHKLVCTHILTYTNVPFPFLHTQKPSYFQADQLCHTHYSEMHMCMYSHVHKHTQRGTHQDTYFLHIPSVVLNRLGIDGRYAFVLLSRLIKVNETRVCVCVSGPCSCCRSGPSSFFLCVSFSLSLTGPAGFFIQGAWSIWPFCLAINIDQRPSIPSTPRQRPRVHCACLPFLYHSPTNPQTALSLYEGILA